MRILGRAGLSVAIVLAIVPVVEAGQTQTPNRTPPKAYQAACINCHGPEGKGGVNKELEKLIKLPDFSDCSFANREPDNDWLAVAHKGGPARGFSPLMAPWSSTFSSEELGLAVSHIRSFCSDARWPRGELNLPLALVTGKAFPEDEAVVKVTEQEGNVVTRFVYERRFGADNQWEIALPIVSADSDSGRSTGVGDIALGYKRVLGHSVTRGNIFSLSTEVKLPTGSERTGLGGGVTVFEPFLTFGQILPRDGFIQAQAGFELPLESGHDNETFWRVAVGKSFEQGRFGRTWSPMIEVLAARPLSSDAKIDWDVVPQMQVTLNARQHIRVSGGVRVPVNNTDGRSTSVIFYLLWDWFDGGFFQGW